MIYAYAIAEEKVHVQTLALSCNQMFAMQRLASVRRNGVIPSAFNAVDTCSPLRRRVDRDDRLDCSESALTEHSNTVHFSGRPTEDRHLHGRPDGRQVVGY